MPASCLPATQCGHLGPPDLTNIPPARAMLAARAVLLRRGATRSLYRLGEFQLVGSGLIKEQGIHAGRSVRLPGISLSCLGRCLQSEHVRHLLSASEGAATRALGWAPIQSG